MTRLPLIHPIVAIIVAYFEPEEVTMMESDDTIAFFFHNLLAPDTVDFARFCERAAQKGQLNVLEWTRSFPHLFRWGPGVCMRAASQGRIEVLSWLRARGCPWSESTNIAAAWGGHLDTLKWLETQGWECPATNSWVIRAAARRGHLHVLRWLFEQDATWDGGVAALPSYWRDPEILAEAVRNKTFDTVIWLCELRLDSMLSPVVCVRAAQLGRLDMLRWLRAQDPPCPWGTLTFIAAVKNCDIQMLNWLMAEGCPQPGGTCACEHAAGGGDLAMLRLLRARGFWWGEDVCRAAARGGHTKVIAWMRAQDPPCPWNEDVINFTISGPLSEAQCLETLKVLRGLNPPCPWNAWPPDQAAYRGSIEILKWLHAQRCPWREGAFITVIREGLGNSKCLEILKWIRAQGLPHVWDARVCAAAAHRGRLSVLKWLRAQGCPWDSRTRAEAEYTDCHEVAAWAATEGCPPPQPGDLIGGEGEG